MCALSVSNFARDFPARETLDFRDVLLTDSRNVAVEEFRVMQGFGM
jgi:hypothetical protein